jgi:carbonic anhydrase
VSQPGFRRNLNRILSQLTRSKKMVPMRNHHGFKIAALLSAALTFCAQPSLAALDFAETLFLAKSSDPVWPWMVLVFVVGGSLSLIFNYFERERTKRIEELAQSLGFPFRHTPTAADSDLPIGCYLAETGRDPAVSNVLEVSRADELDFVLFEYEYTVGYGRSRHTTHQTIARMRSPLLKLPPFLLFPETIFSKIAVVFGQTDVNFEDSPEFSDQYILRGGDEAALRAIFSPALRQALTPLNHLTIEGADDVLFIFRTDRRIKPEDLVSHIEEDKKILALFFEAQQQTAKKTCV